MSSPTIVEDQLFELLFDVISLDSVYQGAQANSTTDDVWTIRNQTSNFADKSAEGQPIDLIAFEKLSTDDQKTTTGELVLEDELRYKMLHHLTDVSRHLSGKPNLVQQNFDLVTSLWNMQPTVRPNVCATCSSAASTAVQGTCSCDDQSIGGETCDQLAKSAGDNQLTLANPSLFVQIQL